MDEPSHMRAKALPAREGPACAVSEAPSGAVCVAQKLFWIFIWGSFVGFIVETLYCLTQNGHFEWRGSMLLLPLSAVYGIGALAFYLGVPQADKASILRIFLSGAVIGTIVEFFCSWAQQTMFGSVSWDYSQLPFNINGRVCLLYTVFWGVLAVFWAKLLQPFIERRAAKVFHGTIRPSTLVLFIVIVISIIISAYAVARWGARLEGLPAIGIFDAWSDRLFPDTTMEWLYANMKFSD
jgi:uncharacterized membrane protein